MFGIDPERGSSVIESGCIFMRYLNICYLTHTQDWFCALISKSRLNPQKNTSFLFCKMICIYYLLAHIARFRNVACVRKL